MKIPELLLPAGNLEKMHTAFDFGADAVYAGQPRYSLRARNNEFMLPQLLEGIAIAKARGKKFFVTSNLLPHNDKVKTYLRDIAPIMDAKPDALIMADPGLISLLLEKYPWAVVHLSVQANTLNSAAVKFWQKIGVKRVILSRELSLNEIAAIRDECPDMEIEVFVHGALCIAYSGRCLLSGYFTHRDSNQGTCTNSCRWDYKMINAKEYESGEILPNVLPINASAIMNQEMFADDGSCGKPNHRDPRADNVYLLEESKRQGEENYLPIMEDEHGTYIMNSKDLRAVHHIERLVKIGVDSLKIEGRTKSSYYVARTAQTYRQAIDDAVSGKPFNPQHYQDLEGLANRGYTDGFLSRHKSNEQQNYLNSSSESAVSRFVGKVIEHRNGLGLIEVKNKFAVGDKIEIIHPRGNHKQDVLSMFDINLQPINVAPGSPHQMWIPIPAEDLGAFVVRLN